MNQRRKIRGDRGLIGIPTRHDMMTNDSDVHDAEVTVAETWE